MQARDPDPRLDIVRIGGSHCLELLQRLGMLARTRELFGGLPPAGLRARHE
jgi:hypothetical protein